MTLNRLLGSIIEGSSQPKSTAINNEISNSRSTQRLSQLSAQMGSIEPTSTIDSPPTQQIPHYGDWPNSQGFDTTYEERTPIELRVEGKIPTYAAGVLFRTGLGPRSVDCGEKGIFKTNHWFDNFAQVHRFQIHPPANPGENVRVTYNSRLTSDGLIAKVRKAGRLEGITFGAKYEPCKTLFQKIQSYFTPFLPAPPPPKADEVNVGVTMSINYPGLSTTGTAASGATSKTGISTFCTRTDSTMIQMLNSETLEPIGLAKQEVLHPELVGPVSGAHAKSDPVTGDVYNFNLQFASPNAYFRVFRTSASTGKTSILATIRHTAAYLHSLFLTENYVIICIWNSYFKAGGAMILWKNNLVESMEYNKTQPAKWFVIDRKSAEEGGKGIIATYESPPFFGFHTVNAYEQQAADGSKEIIADIPVYQNMEIMNTFYMDNLLSDGPNAGAVQKLWGEEALAPKYRRYRLPNIPAEPSTEVRKTVQEFELSRFDTPELPTLNSKVFMKKHRYVYGVHGSDRSTFADSIAKLDMEDISVKRWSKHGHTAGEAIFIADPESEEEDGGVLLTVVLDGTAGKSYLLVLDAKDLSELGKAHVNGVIGFGFHGIHAKETSGNEMTVPMNF